MASRAATRRLHGTNAAVAPLRMGAAVAAHFFVRSIFESEKSPTPAAVRAATRTSYIESACRPVTAYGWLGAVKIKINFFSNLNL